ESDVDEVGDLGMYSIEDEELSLVDGVLEGALGALGTDIAKISRKRSKPDNHEHGNGIECAKAGECYQDIEHQMIEGMKGQDPREARRPRSIFGRL
ncbi:hypothetical protein Tco_1160377, partial [Tanacetum coccineum]